MKGSDDLCVDGSAGAVTASSAALGTVAYAHRLVRHAYNTGAIRPVYPVKLMKLLCSLDSQRSMDRQRS